MNRIKLFLNLLLMVVLTSACTNQNQQNADSSGLAAETVSRQKNNYVALTKQVPQLKAFAEAAAEMKKDDGENFGSFHVVFCGRNVEQLTDHKLMMPYIEQLQQTGAKLIACGFSLAQFNIDAEDLADGIEVVENGIAYSLKMKKEGAYSIDQ